MYPRDLLADVLLLSDAEELMYRRLLDYQWLHNEVPADPKDRAAAARMTLAKAKRAWDRVSAFFPDRGPGGGHRNRRMERIRQDQAESRRRRSEAGRKGNDKRWSGDDSPSQSDRNATAMGSLAVAVAVAEAGTTTTTTARAREQVRAVLPEEAHEPLDRLLRASGNPEGMLDALTRLLAADPKAIPTGAGMRGEDPAVVGACLVDLANSDRPTWNPGYFRGMIQRAKATPRHRGPGAKESPGESILRRHRERLAREAAA